MNGRIKNEGLSVKVEGGEGHRGVDLHSEWGHAYMNMYMLKSIDLKPQYEYDFICWLKTHVRNLLSLLEYSSDFLQVNLPKIILRKQKAKVSM